ncbi:hypothetical protein [Dyella sp.]|uniref:hypothetical protein n=1 Tax=Dyella sp. TaxID=1869338 RepID=UPI003F808322
MNHVLQLRDFFAAADLPPQIESIEKQASNRLLARCDGMLQGLERGAAGAWVWLGLSGTLPQVMA